MKRKSYYGSNSNHSSSSGMGLLGVLQIIFIVLKCLDLVSWTWVQVFIPAFISLGLFLIVILAIFVIAWGAANDKH